MNVDFLSQSYNLNYALLFSTGPVPMDQVHYCERFIELMIDLEVKHNLLNHTFLSHVNFLFMLRDNAFILRLVSMGLSVQG